MHAMPNQAIILLNVLQDMKKLLVVKLKNHSNIILMNLKTCLTMLHQIHEELETFQDLDCDYVPTSEEDEEDVPERPLPGESEDEQEDPLAEIYPESSIQGGGICCLGATASPEKKLPQTWQRETQVDRKRCLV